MMSNAEQMTLIAEEATPRRCALSSGSRLLGPIRDAVDRAQKDARAALDAMDEDEKNTMAWDSCEDAIDHLELDWLYSSRGDVRGNIWDAEALREGYDTWPRAARLKHIERLKRLGDALQHLIGVLKHLNEREAEELHANK